MGGPRATAAPTACGRPSSSRSRSPGRSGARRLRPGAGPTLSLTRRGPDGDVHGSRRDRARDLAGSAGTSADTPPTRRRCGGSPRSRRATPRRRTSSTPWSRRPPGWWASASRRCCASTPTAAHEVVALHDPPEGVTVGMRASGEGDGATQRVWRTGRAARVDRLTEAPGRVAAGRCEPRLLVQCGGPDLRRRIACGASSWRLASDRLPPGVEEHLTNFARLAGTAISAAEARSGVRELAEEQAALRRVAELAATGASRSEILEAVVIETSGRLDGAETALMQYGAEGVATVVATHPDSSLRGVRVPLSGRSSTADVFRTGQPSRTDDYARSDTADLARAHGVTATVSVPIAGRRRGLGSPHDRLPERAAAGRARGPHQQVRRAGRHRGLERARPRGAASPRRRAGSAPPRRGTGRPTCAAG